MGLLDNIGAALGGLTGGGIPVIGGALNLISGNYGAEQANARQIDQTNMANAFTADQTQKQMNFQERMSSTAHQREVADLKAAGLNPMLSVNAGSSTPQGGAGAGQQAQMRNTLEGLTANALQAGQLAMQNKRTNSDIELNKALAKKADVEAFVATKGIPEADMKNKIYEWMTSTAKDMRQKSIAIDPKNWDKSSFNPRNIIKLKKP